MNFGPCSLFGNPDLGRCQPHRGRRRHPHRTLNSDHDHEARALPRARGARPPRRRDGGLARDERSARHGGDGAAAGRGGGTHDRRRAHRQNVVPDGQGGLPALLQHPRALERRRQAPQPRRQPLQRRRPEGVAANVRASRPPPWRLRPARSAVPAARRAAHPPPAARRARRYQTLTGKKFVDLREKTRCVAITAGLKEAVSQGCTLPNCSPEVACSTFC